MKVSENWEIAKEELSNSDSIMMKIIELYGGEKIQLKNNAFRTLVRSVVGQQISVKAADSVWKKLEKSTQNKMKIDPKMSEFSTFLRKGDFVKMLVFHQENQRF